MHKHLWETHFMWVDGYRMINCPHCPELFHKLVGLSWHAEYNHGVKTCPEKGYWFHCLECFAKHEERDEMEWHMLSSVCKKKKQIQCDMSYLSSIERCRRKNAENHFDETKVAFNNNRKTEGTDAESNLSDDGVNAEYQCFNNSFGRKQSPLKTNTKNSSNISGLKNDTTIASNFHRSSTKVAASVVRFFSCSKQDRSHNKSYEDATKYAKKNKKRKRQPTFWELHC